MGGPSAPPVLDERFELRGPLGSGGMGEVYRAYDRVRGEEVALKLLPELDATALMRFKTEFHALHDLQHPNLVALHELHEDRGKWFFTMQLVDGVDLFTWLGVDRVPGTRCDEAKLRHVLPQIATALHHLHGAGLVHRDVKPPNVIVTPAGRAMLLDFGLIARTWAPGEGVGTPAFMAPEQVDGHVAPATDWYAFGILLFRALTGALPFSGSPEAIMQAKVSRWAPTVLSVRGDAPADLAALADALLAREPRARPDGVAVLAALGADAPAWPVMRDVLVGRARELAALDAALAERLAGRSLTVCVVGESGIGKTTLLHAFAETAAQRAWVCSGRCWEREAVPYKGVDGVIDELVAQLEHEAGWEPSETDAQGSFVGGWPAILVQAFPVLRRVPAFADVETVIDDEQRGNAVRLSSAVRWLLAEVAACQPLVVIVDDLHWADRDTMTLLRSLLEPPIPGVLLVFGTRDAIDVAGEVRVLSLAPLSESETVELVAMVAHDERARLDVESIAREAGGHPLFAAELARHAVTTGQRTSITLDDAIVQLTRRLGERARAVAELISLAHAPLPLAVAADAAGDTPASFFAALTALRGARVVATSGAGAHVRVEAYHDRARRALSSSITSEARSGIHVRIAEALERSDKADPEAIALHWYDAGRAASAVRYALAAAQQAEATLAFHRAARLYLWAAELAPELDDARIKAGMCLGHVGRGVEAAELFLACAQREQGVRALDLRRRAMAQLFFMGHTERATKLLHELMREVALPDPSSMRGLLLTLLRNRLWLRIHRPALHDKPAEPGAVDRARMDLLWDVSGGIILLEPVRAFYYHSVGLELAIRTRDDSRLLRALLGEVPYLATGGVRTPRLEQTLALMDEGARRHAVPALANIARGLVAFLLGEWRATFEHLTAAERQLTRERPPLVADSLGSTQLVHMLGMTRRFPVAALFYLGQLRELLRRLPELLRDAVERNDVNAATYFRAGVQCVAYLAVDDVDTATRNVEAASAPWQTTRGLVPHFMDLHARASIDMYLGDGELAYRRVVERWPDFDATHLFRAQYPRVSLVDLRGRTALACARTATARRRDALLGDASRCAKQLRAMNALWSVPLGDAIAGGVAAARGNHEHACVLLERAAAGFAAAEMPLYAAAARRSAGLLGGDSGRADAAHAVLSAGGIEDVDRFSQVWLPRVAS